MVVRTGILDYSVTSVRYDHDFLCFITFQITVHSFQKMVFTSLSNLLLQLAETGITADTVLMFVPLPVRHVDTQTDCVLVRHDGRVQDVMKVFFFSNFPYFMAVFFLSRLGFRIKIYLVCFYVGEIWLYTAYKTKQDAGFFLYYIIV